MPCSRAGKLSQSTGIHRESTATIIDLRQTMEAISEGRMARPDNDQGVCVCIYV